MKKLLTIAALLGSMLSQAQDPVVRTSADIYLGLRKLNVLGSVLYIAAHPDDENTRLLAYLSKDRLYRTGYLSLTRGDGGQNLIGDEQGIELGLIRTQELLAARRIDGAEQFFTRAYDFGFSKTPQETFTKWDREKILSDVVWRIRSFRPDVIITRFPTTGEGGHGHHTASAILADEAFSAAADPKRFPEQLKWVQPWQAKRIFWNTFNFGSTNTTSSDQYHFDVGGFNPILGKSYGEIAAESRSQHKSQGFGVPRQRGEAIEFFKQTGGEAMSAGMMDGISLEWARMPGGTSIGAQVAQVIAGFDFMAPQKSVPALVDIYKALKAAPDSYWRTQKMQEVQRLVEEASGLWLEAFTGEGTAVQTDSVRVSFVLNDRLDVPMTLESVQCGPFDTLLKKPVAGNTNITIAKTWLIGSNTTITQPYWLREPMDEAVFRVSDQQKIGQADPDPAYTATFTVNISGERFALTRPVRYKSTDPVKGELYQPLYIIPRTNIGITPDVLLLPGDEKESRPGFVHVTANRPLDNTANAWLLSRSAPTQIDGTQRLLLQRGGSRDFPFAFNRKTQKVARDTALAHLSFTGPDPWTDSLDMRVIGYNHIPAIRYFRKDPLMVIAADIKTRGKKIGYIVGAGDKVPAALEQMGYEVSMLHEADLARLNLQTFDAIISGVRAYNTDEWLNTYYDKLMKYVENGGNLIVQYNTSNQIGPVKARIGPYPFNITRNRVTDENAAVTFLKPEHPVLNFPNKIGTDDFTGWIQERSIYHAADLDPHFEKIFRMADPGEGPDDGSLVIANYGKGFFTYTGIVFFRELPAGVPGAYRLLANLIALNQKKEL